MKKSRLFILLLLGLSAAGAWAQNVVAVWQYDGTVAKFAFTEKPVVTYSANEMVMTTTRTSVRYPISRLQKIVFGVDEIDTSLEEVKSSLSGDVKFSFRDGSLVVSGGNAGAIVNLYQSNGVFAGQFRLDDDGSVTIPTSNLSNGVYIVNTQKMSFKFYKP